MSALATTRPTGAEPLLDVSGVAVELGGRRVLHDVDLRVTQGEMVGLVGPNGAGKTTLLRAVLGLLAPNEGRIRLEGLDPVGARGRLGYVPQRHEFAWDFPISVAGAVLSGRVQRRGWFARRSATDLDCVEEALERVALTDLRHRPVGELSGGQRQRVLVARALVLQPRLLLLDEPFTGLDVTTQQLLTTLFGQLRREGAALLMTTHDLSAAAASCTRLCLLNRTVIADDCPAALTDPAVWLEAFGIAGAAQLATMTAGES